MKSPILLKTRLPSHDFLQFFAPRKYTDFLRKIQEFTSEYREIRVWYRDTEDCRVLLTEENYWMVVSNWPWMELRAEVETVGSLWTKSCEKGKVYWEKGINFARKKTEKVKIIGKKWVETMKMKIKDQNLSLKYEKFVLYAKNGFRTVNLSARKGKNYLFFQANSLFSTICQTFQSQKTQFDSNKRLYFSFFTLLTLVSVLLLTLYELPVTYFEQKIDLSQIIERKISENTINLCFLVPECEAYLKEKRYKPEIQGNFMFIGKKFHGILIDFQGNTIKIGDFDSKYEQIGPGIRIEKSQISLGKFSNNSLTEGRVAFPGNNIIIEGYFDKNEVIDGKEAVFSGVLRDIYREIKRSSDVIWLYRGQWKNWMFEGTGELQDADGVYVGDFVRGKATGKGVLRMNSGEVYVGVFREKLPHGLGCRYDTKGVDTCCRYESGLCEGEAIRSRANKVERVTYEKGQERKGFWG